MVGASHLLNVTPCEIYKERIPREISFGKAHVHRDLSMLACAHNQNVIKSSLLVVVEDVFLLVTFTQRKCELCWI